MLEGYGIIKNTNADALMVEVNTAIQDGWKPRGSLVVIPNPDPETTEGINLFIQTVEKYTR